MGTSAALTGKSATASAPPGLQDGQYAPWPPRGSPRRILRATRCEPVDWNGQIHQHIGMDAAGNGTIVTIVLNLPDSRSFAQRSAHLRSDSERRAKMRIILEAKKSPIYRHHRMFLQHFARDMSLTLLFTLGCHFVRSRWYLRSLKHFRCWGRFVAPITPAHM